MPIDRTDSLQILSELKDARVKIENRLKGAMFGEFVLQWDNGLCLTHEDLIRGFGSAKLFGSQKEASAYRTEHNIRNQGGHSPMPVRAFTAGELALRLCDDALDLIRAGLDAA